MLGHTLESTTHWVLCWDVHKNVLLTEYVPGTHGNIMLTEQEFCRLWLKPRIRCPIKQHFQVTQGFQTFKCHFHESSRSHCIIPQNKRSDLKVKEIFVGGVSFLLMTHCNRHTLGTNTFYSRVTITAFGNTTPRSHFSLLRVNFLN